MKGEGMPLFGNQDVKGDLFIEYNVVLPVEISSEMRRSEFLSLLSLSFLMYLPRTRGRFSNTFVHTRRIMK